MKLRAPFPWFGGKSRVAHLVWDRFGDVANYVEPFFGSGAVLLARPHEPRVETVNDADCYLANFWRAISRDPEAVAAAADWPVNEADLHARHLWLVSRADFRERMKTDPEYFDAKIAGWWVWGISQWIGSGWCSQPDWTGRYARGAARGIFTAQEKRRPALSCSMGVHSKRPDVGRRGGKGVHRKLPLIGGTVGTGVHRRRADLEGWFEQLADRLRRVRVCCGDWELILGPSPTYLIGTTGVFLDPPYEPSVIAEGAGSNGFSKSDRLYSQHETGLSARVRTWAIENGDNPKLRIALCGYEGEHEMPSTWPVVAWTSSGGYSNRGANPRRNAHRERIWFSPHCISPASAGPLFAEASR